MKTVPERPDIIASEVWQDEWPNHTTLYIYQFGASPEITNHISDVKFQVTGGEGVVSTDGVVAELGEGSEVTILAGTPYRYSGRMHFLMHAQPALMPAFVTFGNEKLGLKQRRILARLRREETYIKFVDSILPDLQPMLEIMNKFQRFHEVE